MKNNKSKTKSLLDRGRRVSPAYVILPFNTQGRDLVCGDIHGELDLLKKALAAVGFNKRVDRLICCGDLVDRGPHSFELLKFFSANKTCMTSVLGNHDAVALAVLSGNAGAMYLAKRIGNKWLPLSPRQSIKAYAFLNTLPVTLGFQLRDGRRIGVVHADFPRHLHWPLTEQVRMSDALSTEHDSSLAVAFWGRSRAFAAVDVLAGQVPYSHATAAILEDGPFAPVPNIDLIFCGHTTTESPLAFANFIDIDTACGYPNGGLTIADPAARAYCTTYPGDKASVLGWLPEPVSLKPPSVKPAVEGKHLDQRKE